MRTGVRWLLALVLAAPLAGSAWADEGKEGGRDADKHDGFPMIERMAKPLDLSTAQVDQLKKLERAHREAMKPLWQQMKGQMEALKGLVDKKGSDAELTAAVEQVKATHKTIQAENEKHMDAAGLVLTPMQRAKAALWMGRMADKRWKHMKHEVRGGHEGHEGDDGDEKHGGKGGDGDGDDD